MLIHYLKIAFRNLWKYKTQTVISIAGLAVGFVCFSLAAMWIRYEMTYDSFHKNADHLYIVTVPDVFSGVTRSVPYPFPAYLKETFPEVKEAINIFGGRKKSTFELEDQKIELNVVFADSAFLKMFDVKIVEGNLDFSDYTKNEVAITKEKAQALFGKESPIAKKLTCYGTEYLITAVVSGYSAHSNFPFDILGVVWHNDHQWTITSGSENILELYPDVNIETFKQKLYEHKISQGEVNRAEWTHTSLVALTDLRAEDPTMIREIKFQHIQLFAWAGILVILCSLFNYLTLFVSRFKIREKELALRMVCGASSKSLFSLLLVEFLSTLLIALLLGVVIMNLVSPIFQELSEIQMNLTGIYTKLGLYIFIIILLTILLFAFTLAVFRKYSLNTSIRRNNHQVFRKLSIVAQLIISIGFVFCTTVMIKQVRYLHNSTDIGFEYKNRSYLQYYGNDLTAIYDKMKQVPEITDVVIGYSSLMPVFEKMGSNQGAWDGKTDTDEEFFIQQIPISKAFANFYGLQLISGEMITEEDGEKSVLINESAMKAFGWNKDNAIGKNFSSGGKCNVKGVIKNTYNGIPTVEVSPIYYNQIEQDRKNKILFKYTNRDIAEAKIRKLIKSEYPQSSENEFIIYDAEEAYEKLFQSENALIMILNFVSAICIVISVFGFFSLVSLSCEERRKEIAIRKVNGASIREILSIFLKEYALLLVIGAVIAFPIAYYIMKGWLEQYINQTTIDAWIYVAILLLLISVIALCVGWRVYKTSKENPAEVIKSE